MKNVLFASILALATICTPPAFALGANSDANLKQRVAQQVMQDTHRRTDPSSITLVNVHRGWFNVSWEADTPNGHYACSGDDMLRNWSCTRIDDEATQTAANGG